jgi:hypothetical protein
VAISAPLEDQVVKQEHFSKSLRDLADSIDAGRFVVKTLEYTPSFDATELARGPDGFLSAAAGKMTACIEIRGELFVKP